MEDKKSQSLISLRINKKRPCPLSGRALFLPFLYERSSKGVGIFIPRTSVSIPGDYRKEELEWAFGILRFYISDGMEKLGRGFSASSSNNSNTYSPLIH